MLTNKALKLIGSLHFFFTRKKHIANKGKKKKNIEENNIHTLPSVASNTIWGLMIGA